jgi:anti-anti-sigma regulatory factor
MEIDVSTERGSVPVTVVRPHGYLDASTYTELIDAVRRLFMEGAKDFLIDLGDVAFISSAGLMAIHSLAIMLRGEAPPDSEPEMTALKKPDRSRAWGLQKHIKLLGLNEGVAATFDKAGFTPFFQVFSDQHEAIASF